MGRATTRRKNRRTKQAARYNYAHDALGRFGLGSGGAPTTTKDAVERWTGDLKDVSKVREQADAIMQGQPTADTRAAADAHALIAGINASDPTTASLYRGMNIPAEAASAYQEGQPVHFSLGSFSEDPDVAAAASSHVGSGRDGVPVVYTLDPGAQTLPVASVGVEHEQEHITGGSFQVERVEPGFTPDSHTPPGVRVTLRQTEPVHAPA